MEASKKKAIEIYDSMLKCQDNYNDYKERNIISFSAKKCSIITVDEILKNIEATELYHKESEAIPINKQFWNEVKQHLNEM